MWTDKVRRNGQRKGLHMRLPELRRGRLDSRRVDVRRELIHVLLAGSRRGERPRLWERLS